MKKCTGKKIRKELGMSAMAIKIKPRINKALKKNSKIILDGLYSWEEYFYLKKLTKISKTNKTIYKNLYKKTPKFFKGLVRNKNKSFQKFLETNTEERIGKFNLFLIGSMALIIVFSVGQIITQKIILIGLENNLPEFQITTDIFVDGNSTAEKRNGSPLRPFKSIHQAINFIQENSEIKNIYIYPYQYEGSLEIPQNINLYAFHPDTFVVSSLSDKKI